MASLAISTQGAASTNVQPTVEASESSHADPMNLVSQHATSINPIGESTEVMAHVSIKTPKSAHKATNGASGGQYLNPNDHRETLPDDVG